MSNLKEIEVGDGVVTLSNDYPVSYRSAHGHKDIRQLERSISEKLGHPAILLTYGKGWERDGHFEGRLLHPDSVLVSKHIVQKSNFPLENSDFLGLWDGDDISSLYSLLLREKLLVKRSDHTLDEYRDLSGIYRAVFSMQSRRLSKKEKSGNIKADDARRMAYFIDKSDRCLLYFAEANGVILCPETSSMLAFMKRFGEFPIPPFRFKELEGVVNEMGCELIQGNDL